MDGAKIGAAAMVMPGAFVGVGKTVPAGQLWGGVPARYLREVTQAETEKVASVSQQNALLASEHALEGAKSWQTIEQEEYDHEQMAGRSDEHEYLDLVKLIIDTGARKSDRTGWRCGLLVTSETKRC